MYIAINLQNLAEQCRTLVYLEEHCKILQNLAEICVRVVIHVKILPNFIMCVESWLTLVAG